MNRRKFLQGAGAAATILNGCSSGGGSGSSSTPTTPEEQLNLQETINYVVNTYGFN